MSEDLKTVAERLLESGKMIDELRDLLHADIITLATAWVEFNPEGGYINLDDLSYQGVEDDNLGLEYSVYSRGYSWNDYASIPLGFFLDPTEFKAALDAAVLIQADREKLIEEEQKERVREHELRMLKALKLKYEGGEDVWEHR